MTPAQVFSVTREPMLRWQDVPGGESLAEQMILHPGDEHLRDLFNHVVEHQASQALACRDPFRQNWPVFQELSPLRGGTIPIAALPTGDVLAIPATGICKGVLVVGPTGGGKTSLLRLAIAALVLGGAA